MYGRLAAWRGGVAERATRDDALGIVRASPFFGAIPVNERVVVDGDWVFAAGVTSGNDGALRLTADLRGEDAAKLIQLSIQYAPEPPFDAGTPESAPATI